MEQERTFTVQQPATTELADTIHPLVKRAAALMITNAAEYQLALDILRQLADGERRVIDHYAEPKQLSHRAHRAIVGAEREWLTPIRTARRTVDFKKIKWEEKAEQEAREAQARLDAAQRKEQEARALEEAAELEAAGDVDAADAVLDEATHTVPTVRVQPDIPKSDGMTTTERWSAEVVDVRALQKYVAEHPEFENLLVPHMPSLNSMARALRSAMTIAGVRAVCKKTTAVRAQTR